MKTGEMEQLEAEIKQLIVDSLRLEDVEAKDIESGAPLFIEGLGLDSIDALELAMAPADEVLGRFVRERPQLLEQRIEPPVLEAVLRLQISAAFGAEPRFHAHPLIVRKHSCICDDLRGLYPKSGRKCPKLGRKCPKLGRPAKAGFDEGS